jgi:hypothetical protein
MTYSLLASILVITCSRLNKAATVDPVGRNAYCKSKGQWSMFERRVEKASDNIVFDNTSENWPVVLSAE